MSSYFISNDISFLFSVAIYTHQHTFLVSNMRVPAASSIMERISGGFMFRTLVMRPYSQDGEEVR